MASKEIVKITPKPPKAEDFERMNPALRYNRVSDTLMIYLYGAPEAAISVDAGDDYTYLRVHPESHEIVGLQIEHFLSELVHEVPQTLVFAELAGISQDEINTLREQMTPEKRSRAAVGYWIEQFFAPRHLATARS